MPTEPLSHSWWQRRTAPVLLIPAICGSLYPRATARRLSPIIEYVVTRAIVRRLIGTLHHDADSVGAKSTHGQLPMGLLAREVDARAQLMRSGAQRGLLKVTGESALRRSSCVWTNSSLCCGDSVYFTEMSLCPRLTSPGPGPQEACSMCCRRFSVCRQMHQIAD